MQFIGRQDTMQKNSYPSSGNLDFESRLFQALESIKEKIPQEEISYLAKKARVILLDFCDVQKRYYLEFLPEGKCNIGNKILDLSPMIHVTITTKTWESMANQSLNPMSAFLEKKISIVGLPLLESRVFMPFAWKFLAAYQENFSLPEKSRSIKAPIPSSPKGFFKNLLRFPVTLVLLCIPALRFLKLRKWTLSLENWMEDTWYLWDKEMRRNLAFGRRKESYSNTSKWNKDQRLVVLSNTQEIKIEKEEPKSPPFVLLAEEEISEEPAQSSKEKAPEPANTQQKTPENKNPESIPLQVGDEKKTDSLKARASQKIGEELPIAEPQINIDRSTPEQAGKNAEEIVISKPIPAVIVNDTKISSSSSHEAIVIPQEETSMIFSGEEELSENEAIIFAHEAIEANESISSLKKEEKAVYIEFSEPLKNNAKTPKNILEEKISLEEESDWDDSQENITIIDLEKEKAIEDAPPIKKEEKDEKITIVDLEKEKNKKNHRKSWEDSEDDITVVDLEKKWQDDNLEESR
ncbi:MAG: hypothetical protein HUU50_21610, partial [Candidatus Brocadiae bacterium]|nr:hypothetical protein [Candidatus Brocadiia bacterium]